MSIKSYTTPQLQQDLDTIFRMWPGGVPPEQTDRVNAIKTELKRRGAELRPAPTVVQPQQLQRAISQEPTSGMSYAALKRELASVVKSINLDPGNDDLQNRFADLRYEVRQREKQGRTDDEVGETAKAAPPPSSPSVAPREIEIPDDIELNPMAGRLVPRRDEAPPPRTEPAEENQAQLQRRVAGVKGFTVQVVDGGVLLTFGARSAGGANVIQLATVFKPEDGDDLLAMLGDAFAKARGLS